MQVNRQHILPCILYNTLMLNTLVHVIFFFLHYQKNIYITVSVINFPKWQQTYF